MNNPAVGGAAHGSNDGAAAQNYIYVFKVANGKRIREYVFEADKMLSSHDNGKRVYLGRFPKDKNASLPTGIKYDKDYCLKTASVILPMNRTYPQSRYFWDFFPFKGDNLREVLLLNDRAASMASRLESGILKPFHSDEYMGRYERYDCAVIEPVYKPFCYEDFPEPIDKIDCMLQVINGLRQLMGNEMLQGCSITAHRDMKFSNIMIDNKNGARRIRLIDFPTVKIRYSVDVNGSAGSDSTYQGILSISNTAPEDMMPGYEVSEKTDVFALGTMLAEIFGVWDYDGDRNPLSLLFCRPGIKIDNPASCKSFYTDILAAPDIDRSKWLEQLLNAHEKNAAWDEIRCFEYDRISEQNGGLALSDRIKSLFRRATAIDPNDRSNLDEFEGELMEIKQILESVPNDPAPTVSYNGRTAYILLDTANLGNYKSVYAAAIRNILIQDGCDSVSVMPYCWYDNANAIVPDQGEPDIRIVDNESIEGILSQIEQQKDISVTFASGLKRAMYDLFGALQNVSRQQSFNGKLYILASEFPHEDNGGNGNMCSLKTLDMSAGGITKEVYHNAAEIADMLKKCNANFEITVYSFAREDSVIDGWYKAVELTESAEPAQNTDEPKPAQETPDDPSPKKKQLKGFSFLKGTIQNN